MAKKITTREEAEVEIEKLEAKIEKLEEEFEIEYPNTVPDPTPYVTPKKDYSWISWIPFFAGLVLFIFFVGRYSFTGLGIGASKPIVETEQIIENRPTAAIAVTTNGITDYEFAASQQIIVTKPTGQTHCPNGKYSWHQNRYISREDICLPFDISEIE